MARLNFRIGTKLGLTAGIGVLLIAGMMTNEIIGNDSIALSSRMVLVNTSNKSDLQGTDVLLARTELAMRNIGSANTVAQMENGLKEVRGHLAGASALLNAAEQRATRQPTKDGYRAIQVIFQKYLTIAADLAAARKAALDGGVERAQATLNWDRAFDGLLASPALAALPNHRDIELELRTADGAYNAARAAVWQFAAAAEPKQIELLSSEAVVAIDSLKRARKLAGEAGQTAVIDTLVAAAVKFKSSAEAVAKAEDRKFHIRDEQAAPLVADIGSRIVKLTEVANGFAAMRQAELLAELSHVATVTLAVGALVVLVQIGSALFSVLTIARPIRRIGEVLLDLAGGNKAVAIPYTERGDEVGDNARAARTFRDNLIRIEQMEAEQKDLEAATAGRRKAEMAKLADAFQAAVGGIVESVSSASGELEKAAGTLSGTAEETQQLSGLVASASEEASANVESVASAAEEMSASVTEISRQVHDSSRIAGEAVKQAELTDVRINELSEAAGRIGDVVKLITAIAEQTNLLALNATIEAARAGESGRGFAVVASEVKALAAQTAKATDEISVQITGMQAATRDSVGAIKEIGSTISRIAEIASIIAATVEEQGAATSEIARNVGEAAKGTAQVAEKITQVNRGASATGSASAQVLMSARSLSKESGSLKSEVESFLQTVRAA
ncbi:methyl-accepting chemotaxis protein [Rhodopseudomonas sp. RCAM05734]|uniref:methyl-accepting chemotaxis protein n=1 Tax=Rhodopseudomonas sp. RCAM05734 TaxID=3457549 RepID=UPI00404519F3